MTSSKMQLELIQQMKTDHRFRLPAGWEVRGSQRHPGAALIGSAYIGKSLMVSRDGKGYLIQAFDSSAGEVSKVRGADRPVGHQWTRSFGDAISIAVTWTMHVREMDSLEIIQAAVLKRAKPDPTRKYDGYLPSPVPTNLGDLFAQTGW